MSSIIHFTREFDRLKNILTECSFKLHYCREVFYLGDKISSSAVHPMVSFSEYSIKTIDKKNITYGKYGIALKRSWVIKNKLHPVLYLDRNSHVATALSGLLRARRQHAEVELAPHVKLCIMTIKCFIKNASGYNSYFDVNNFNFKVEKEWRYVPTKAEIDGNLISQTKRLYDENPDRYNDRLIQYPLRFLLSDIQYIFVNTLVERDLISKQYGINKEIIKISNWKTDLRKN